MAPKQAKSKNKDRLATEQRLLSVAEHIFSKHGFKGATTRMIAKKADVNVALIARYFGGKYELMIKIVENKHSDEGHLNLPYPAQETLTDECLKYAFNKLEMFKTDANFIKVVILQFLTDAKFLKRFQEAIQIFDSHPQFEERINKLIEKKKVKSHASALTIYHTIEDHIFGMFIGRILCKIDQGSMEVDLEHFVRQYCASYEMN